MRWGVGKEIPAQSVHNKITAYIPVTSISGCGERRVSVNHPHGLPYIHIHFSCSTKRKTKLYLGYPSKTLFAVLIHCLCLFPMVSGKGIQQAGFRSIQKRFQLLLVFKFTCSGRGCTRQNVLAWGLSQHEYISLFFRIAAMCCTVFLNSRMRAAYGKHPISTHIIRLSNKCPFSGNGMYAPHQKQIRRAKSADNAAEPTERLQPPHKG